MLLLRHRGKQVRGVLLSLKVHFDQLGEHAVELAYNQVKAFLFVTKCDVVVCALSVVSIFDI